MNLCWQENPLNLLALPLRGPDRSFDEAWLKQAGIGFSAAPGCNAIAVVEYVFSSLLMLAERDGFSLYDRTVGIVGVGNVGRRLQARLEALGIKTLLAIRLAPTVGMRVISARWMS